MNKTATHKRSPKGESFVQKALTKMIIYFSDGNSRTFHSRDYRMKHTAPDKNLGISRLKKYALGNKQFIDTALIYDNKSGEQLFKFRDGYWQ
ncbi:hypothetical protein [Pontibacter russatus]|uniref:hypothetical protein n=1 Tax=Pontibacter russatus TaxID=2694929 RepID=UPI00137A4D7A|nr:hypothetical protein [Pontibacter russatus]